MKSRINFTHQMRVLLTLAVVVILLFVKDVMDKQNVVNLGTSFSSVYEDRLLPESYIYQMSEHIYHKKMLVDNVASRDAVANIRTAVDSHNALILHLVDEFEKTKLTTAEAERFSSFKQNVKETIAREYAYLQALEIAPRAITQKPGVDAHFEASITNLKALSVIQLAEGKRLTDESKRIVAGSSLLSSFELALLVIVVLLLLTLLLSKNIQQVPVAKPELN